MTRRATTLLWGLLGLSACAVESDGEAAAQLRLTDLQGQPHRPLRCPDGVANVIFFVTHDCPIANALAPEVQSIVDDHRQSPLRFLLVHVDPDITGTIAGTHAQDYGLKLPVLLDPHHQLVQELGITITPEAAVWTKAGDLAYRGRINDLFADLGKKRRAPTSHDLRNALSAVLAGQPVESPRTLAIGCDIPDALPLPSALPRRDK